MLVVPRNLHAKYWLNTTEEKGVIKVLPWLLWQLSYHSNVAVWLMPALPRNLHTKFGLNMTKEKGVIKVSPWLPWQLSYHNNEVIGWCLLCQGISIPNIVWIQLKTKELLMFHLGCHGNCVTIATRWLADACHAKYWLNMTEEKEVIKVSLWLPWQLSYHSNKVVGWCLLCQGAFIPNIDWIPLEARELQSEM